MEDDSIGMEDDLKMMEVDMEDDSIDKGYLVIMDVYRYTRGA